ncbi:hypothetical protein, partial [Salsipaludibacter albus]|uniref:hypothetical protein n=1 Tax=Salsipaludibacter albus TaxID=2849650 RepID=UPI002367F69C
MPTVSLRPIVAVLALLLLFPLLPDAAAAAPGDLTDAERQRIEEAGTLTAEERARIDGADELTAEERARIDGARNAVSEVEGRIARVEGEIDATQAELEGLQVELTAASEALTHAQKVAGAAEAAAVDAQQQVQRIRGELSEAQAERDANTQEVRSIARDSFMYGPGASSSMMMIVDGLNNEGGTSDLAQSSHSLDMVLRDRTAVLEDSDRLVAETELLGDEADMLEEAREERLAEADAAREEAAQLHAQVLDLVEQTDTALRRQQDLKAELADEQVQAEAAVADLRAEAAAAAEAREAEA